MFIYIYVYIKAIAICSLWKVCPFNPCSSAILTSLSGDDLIPLTNVCIPGLILHVKEVLTQFYSKLLYKKLTSNLLPGHLGKKNYKKIGRTKKGSNGH